MLNNTFFRILYQRRKAFFWWAFCIGLLCFYMCYMVLSVVDQAVDFNEILNAWPEDLKALFLGTELDMSTPTGFFNAELFNMFLPVLFLIYAIGQGTKALAGEEEEGTLDLVLATPVSRGRYLAEGTLAMVVSVLLLGLVTWLGFILGVMIYDIDISIWALGEAILSTVLLGLVFGCLALAAGASSGRKGMAGGLAAGLAAASFLLNGMSQVVDYLEPFQKVSVFYHHVNIDPLRNGLTWQNTGLLAAVSVVLIGLAWLGFRKRDLAV